MHSIIFWGFLKACLLFCFVVSGASPSWAKESSEQEDCSEMLSSLNYQSRFFGAKDVSWQTTKEIEASLGDSLHFESLETLLKSHQEVLERGRFIKTEGGVLEKIMIRSPQARSRDADIEFHFKNTDFSPERSLILRVGLILENSAQWRVSLTELEDSSQQVNTSESQDVDPHLNSLRDLHPDKELFKLPVKKLYATEDGSHLIIVLSDGSQDISIKLTARESRLLAKNLEGYKSPR